MAANTATSTRAERARKYVELNLNSVYIVTRETVPHMQRGGAICNTSSIAGMLASPLLAAYAAAKAEKSYQEEENRLSDDRLAAWLAR